jgi:hypothetical protein
LSLNDIRVELGIPSQAPFSLNAAAIGSYVAINQGSSSKPNPANPQTVSEWYGYNHASNAQTIRFGSTDTNACNAANGNYYIQNDKDITTADAFTELIYTDAARTNVADSGFYAQFVGGVWKVRSFTRYSSSSGEWTTSATDCPTTTTTTTVSCSSAVTIQGGLSKYAVCCEPASVTVYFSGGSTLASATNAYTNSACTSGSGIWYRDGSTVRQAISGVLQAATDCTGENCA